MRGEEAGDGPGGPLDPARAVLEAALLSHRPADAEEEGDRVRMLDLVRMEPECFARSTFLPGHFTGSAFVVCRATGKVLLHRHRRLGKWLQMGGHDEGEHDLLRTALREGAEESGLGDLVPIGPGLLDLSVHPIPSGKGEPDHRHYDVRYALATARPDAIVRDPAESDALSWFTLEEAAALMSEPASTRALSKLARLV